MQMANPSKRIIQFENLTPPCSETQTFVYEAIEKGRQITIMHEAFRPTNLFISGELYKHLAPDSETLNGMTVHVVYMDAMTAVITSDMPQTEQDSYIRELEIQRLRQMKIAGM